MNRCDYGGCTRHAVTIMDCYCDDRIVERRAACARHARMSPFGVAYNFNSNEETNR